MNTFFESLIKPSWIPPNWAFPAVWFTLWTLQAVALIRVIASGSSGRPLALVLLVAQFATAIAWQAVIFGPGRLLLAAWWLTGVLVITAVCVVACWRTDRLAGALVSPTVVWLSVATALAWSLYNLNPGA
jgi:translocator protein